MNLSDSEFPPVSVPRVNSLQHRLRHAPRAEDQSCLDQLMIFPQDPSASVPDRRKGSLLPSCPFSNSLDPVPIFPSSALCSPPRETFPKKFGHWENLEIGSCLPLSTKPSLAVSNPLNHENHYLNLRLSVSHTPDSPDTLIFSKTLFSTASPRSNGILSKTHQHIPRRATRYHFIAEHPHAPLPPAKSTDTKRTEESVKSSRAFLSSFSVHFYQSQV